MARLAAGRTTQLSADEIAVELLRLFDESGGEPSIRALAAALGVSPRAIYHYYETREQLVLAVLDLVWDEAIGEIALSIADPVHALDDPLEFFVLSAVAVRRAFRRHRRLAMQVATPSGPSQRLSGGLAIIGAGFEQLGLTGEQAGLAVYGYATYVFGSIVLEASRSSDAPAPDGAEPPGDEARARALIPEDAPALSDETFAAIDHIISGGRTGEHEADDAMFAAGLRALLQGFVDHPA